MLLLVLLLHTDHNGMYLLALKESFFSLTHHLIDYRSGRDLKLRLWLLLLVLLLLLLLTDHNGMYLLALLSFIMTLLPRQIWWPILGHVGTLFLPVLQIAAVVIGWKIGQYIMLGEWPNDNNKLVPLPKKVLSLNFFRPFDDPKSLTETETKSFAETMHQQVCVTWKCAFSVPGNMKQSLTRNRAYGDHQMIFFVSPLHGTGVFFFKSSRFPRIDKKSI